jgi:hypothetical protein
MNITQRIAIPTTPVAQDIYLDSGINTISGNPAFRRYDGASWVDIAPVFGTRYQKASSLAESSTTSAIYQQKVRLTTTVLPAGTYYVGFDFNYSSDDENEDMMFQAQVDDTTTIWSANTVQKKILTNGVYNYISGFKTISLTSGSHNIDLDFANANNKITYIKEANIILYRIN